MSIAQPAIQSLPPKGRHHVSGISEQEDPPLREGLRQCGMESIHHLTNNLEMRRAASLQNQRGNGFFLEQILFCLAREKHKFPSSTVIGIRNSHCGPMRITEEFDYGRGFLVGNTIDHQPFLWERCAFHWNVESATDSTFASIARETLEAIQEDCFNFRLIKRGDGWMSIQFVCWCYFRQQAPP